MTQQRQSITITLSIDEYICHTLARGSRWVVIDDERRKHIVSQTGWENEVFIEEITPEENKNQILVRLNNPIFRLWRLKDWQFHKETNTELVKETKIEEIKEASIKHNKLMLWKGEAIKTLMAKGKLPYQKALEHVNYCINPTGTLKVDDFKDTTDLITGEVTETKEKKLGVKVKFYYDLRKKLGWPFEEI